MKSLRHEVTSVNGKGSTVDGKHSGVVTRLMTANKSIGVMAATVIALMLCLPSAAVCADSGWDLNRDGKPDLIFRNYRTGETVIHFLDNTRYLGSVSIDYAKTDRLPALAYADPDWKIVGAGTFIVDASHVSSILWLRSSTGRLEALHLNSGDRAGASLVSDVSSRYWRLEAAADFDGNGYADLIFRQKETGENDVVWLAESHRGVVESLPTVSDLGWEIVGAGDFNGDGKPDLVWSHSTGVNVVWFMDGKRPIGSAYLPTLDTNWKIAQVADYNGDGKTDLALQKNTGMVRFWFLDGTTWIGHQTYYQTYHIPGFGPDWKLGTRVKE